VKYFNKKHILFWALCFLLLFGMYQFVIGVKSPIKHSFTFVIAQLIAFYINLNVLLPRFFDKKQFSWYGLLNILLIVIGAISATLIEDGLPYSKTNGHTVFDSYYTIESHMAHSVPVFIGVFTAFVLYTYNQQLKREEREKERITAEKNFLVQQINPHFLFNTLNNIYSLTLDNNPKGSEAVMQLSKMLDYSLYGNRQEYVALKNEIQYIQNFIDLFKLKDDSLTNIHFESTNTNLNFLIAPMLLLPFVENAFKHGDIETDEGIIKIEVKTRGNQLEFSCVNSFSEIKKVDKVGGIGISNVKRRLELLYSENHGLTIEKKNGIYTVILKIITDET